MTPKAILVATDLSSRSDRAMDRAVALASEWHARLIVLHALQEPVQPVDVPSWQRSHDPRQFAAQQILADLQGALKTEGDVVVEYGEPAPLILEAVKNFGCDLVVTGVARNETLGRMLLGTTAVTLSRQLSVPLLVVKSRPRGPYRNVVVATDFSEGSRCALETAIALLPNAKISLFHAFEVIFEGYLDDAVKVGARERARQHALAESLAFLAKVPAAKALRQPIPTICEYGSPGTLLGDLQQTQGVDLVVLGTEGRSAIATVLIGSVAQVLLSDLPGDVLVVRRAKP